MDGRYAAESDAEVIGTGGGGRSSSDGKDFDIVTRCSLFCALTRLPYARPALKSRKL